MQGAHVKAERRASATVVSSPHGLAKTDVQKIVLSSSAARSRALLICLHACAASMPCRVEKHTKHTSNQVMKPKKRNAPAWPARTPAPGATPTAEALAEPPLEQGPSPQLRRPWPSLQTWPSASWRRRAAASGARRLEAAEEAPGSCAAGAGDPPAGPPPAAGVAHKGTGRSGTVLRHQGHILPRWCALRTSRANARDATLSHK